MRAMLSIQTTLAALAVLFFTPMKGQSIDALLQSAFSNNAELKALQLDYEAVVQRGPQVRNLPDPTLMAALPISRPESRLGGQALQVSASHMFPWFGTLKAKESIVLNMAEASREEILAKRLDVIYTIKNAYYRLFWLEKKARIVERRIRVFEGLERLVLANVESGKGIGSDALQVRVKLEELTQQLPLIVLQKEIYTAEINEMTNAPPDRTIRIVDSITTPAVVRYDLDDDGQRIRSLHPLIRQIDWQIHASDRAMDVNRLASKPSFGLGLDYTVVAQRTDAMPAGNGRDILIPRVIFSLPVYRKKYAAKEEEERLRQAAFALRKVQIENSLIRRLQGHYSEYQQALLGHELALKQIKISQAAYDILLTEYSNKGHRFDELLRLQNDEYMYELAALDAMIRTHLAKIEIDRLTDF